MKILKNRSNRILWDSLYSGFNNIVCNECIEQVSQTRIMSNPQPIPYIGPNFGQDPYGILFYGIETWDNFPRIEGSKADYNVFSTKQVEKLYFENYSPFWFWVAAIAEKVLLPNFGFPFAHIAYSNLIKCQARKENNFYSPHYELSETSLNCIRKAGWIFREINRIGAKNIVIFSGIKKDFFLARLLLNMDNHIDITKFDYRNVTDSRKFDKRNDLFVHLKVGDIRFIITNHPSYTPQQIRDEIIRIIKENDWHSAVNWKMPTMEDV